MPHVGTPRLLRRRMYLTRIIAHDTWNGSRYTFALHALELMRVENELEARGARLQRITIRSCE